MKIYIASSWRNQHGVEMLTALLREKDHQVVSFVEIETKDKDLPFDKWIHSDGAKQCFVFDTEGATTSDLVIYYGPSGKDACAEMGAAWAKNIPIIGLWAKGEDMGLMRHMAIKWCYNYRELLESVEELDKCLNWNNKSGK